MIPTLLIKIALVIIVIRSGYVFIQMLNRRWTNNLLDLLFQASIFIIALSFLI
ncbi:hypothetical protein [Halalkalibacter akibai]|uniref:Uncharacterized protein n=1 Tax=Halalkalibacter akibai (strain ATCC 43226 / DSM 21942 / CIP 109018 / JCM 9157 / 1139) TaxID=1236973 RepID=W4QW65_HALA3|nr:hypothetical protein [Halalkalibacter akibai]GAE36142.1 hypothetical protein JCM9157_3291 [Halalkalibacter akibai JCM 9157]